VGNDEFIDTSGDCNISRVLSLLQKELGKQSPFYAVA